MNILVVDDESDLCEILQFNLETEGYEVVTANSAEEAFKLPLQDDEDNTVKGLNIGADDYITKPLSMKEVKARVKAVLRRSNSQTHQRDTADNKLCYGAIIIDLNTKTATLDSEELALTKLEFELLSFFLRNPDKVFSREELLEQCWPQDVYVLNRTVDVNITRLRKKIGRYGKQIKTRIGYGYCFEEK